MFDILPLKVLQPVQCSRGWHCGEILEIVTQFADCYQKFSGPFCLFNQPRLQGWRVCWAWRNHSGRDVEVSGSQLQHWPHPRVHFPRILESRAKQGNRPRCRHVSFFSHATPISIMFAWFGCPCKFLFSCNTNNSSSPLSLAGLIIEIKGSPASGSPESLQTQRTSWKGPPVRSLRRWRRRLWNQTHLRLPRKSKCLWLRWWIPRRLWWW